MLKATLIVLATLTTIIDVLFKTLHWEVAILGFGAGANSFGVISLILWAALIVWVRKQKAEDVSR